MEIFIIIALSIILLTRISLLFKRPNKTKRKINLEHIKKLSVTTTKDPQILESLPFIEVDSDDIIFLGLLSQHDIDDDLKNNIFTLVDLANSKMFNLGTDLANHEIKNLYGANNFDTILLYDTNYKNFLNLIYLVANSLIKYHKELDSIKILELGVKYNSDLSRNYILLADLYKKFNKYTELKTLIDIIQSRKYLSQKSIIKEISIS